MNTKPDLLSEAQLDPVLNCQIFTTADFICQNIFLTGATGFVGVFLLAEILRMTDAKVFCLVRAVDDISALKRLQQQLTEYGVWQPIYQNRIIPLAGNLGQPNFALPQEKFNFLAKNCDVIIHNGAVVNFMRPYATLKSVNVEGTRQIIALAMRHKTKPVHFISSVAVFFSPCYINEKYITENEPLLFDPDMQGGYKQSKWVAERLLGQARERGLPVNIYRLSRVFGESTTGRGNNFDDLLVRMVKVCIELKSYPLLDTWVNLVPVDYVSQAVVHFINHSQNQVLHLCNPCSIHWMDLFATIQSASFTLQAMNYPQWLKKLEQFSTQRHEDKFYSALLLALKFPNYLLMPKPEFDTRQAIKCLQAANITCPTISTQLMRKYLNYYYQRGFIKELIGDNLL